MRRLRTLYTNEILTNKLRVTCWETKWSKTEEFTTLWQHHQRFFHCCNTCTEIHLHPCMSRKQSSTNKLHTRTKWEPLPAIKLTRKWAYIRYLHVWGNVSLTNTKRALPGASRSLPLKMWMKCPTDMSLGTKNLKCRTRDLLQISQWFFYTDTWTSTGQDTLLHETWNDTKTCTFSKTHVLEAQWVNIIWMLFLHLSFALLFRGF